MFDFLDDIKKNKDELTDVIMWHHLIRPSIVLLKDGSLMSVIKYHGPDLDASTADELVNCMGSLNNIFKRFDSGWVVYCEAQRKKSSSHPKRNFPDLVTQAIDNERRQHFNSGVFYESEYYLSLIFLPPKDAQKKVSNVFLTRIEATCNNDDSIFRQHVDNFQTQIINIYQLFSEAFSSVEILENGSILTYLHSCVSEHDVDIANPKIFNQVPAYIDHLLTDSPVLGGYEPALGKKHMRVIGIKAFPTTSVPGYLDILNRMDIEYRWSNRLIFLDKQEAISELESYRKKFFSGRFSVFALLRQIMTNNADTGLENPEATVKYLEAQENLQILQVDYTAQTYFTSNIILFDENLDELESKAKLVIKAIHGLGFVVYDETINALEAWFGSIPGHCAYNTRRPLYYTLGLMHLLPFSSVWPGHSWNNHLNDNALIYTRTGGSTPFRLNLHYGDVGHTMIVGPTGSGKSVHLALIAAQFMQYKNAQVYFFDKDASSRVLTLGTGGDFYNIGNEDETLSFQPLARIDQEHEFIWANEWIMSILVAEKIVPTAQTKNTVRSALKALSSAPVEQRTFTGLSINIQDRNLREALEQFTIKGIYGRMLDSNYDNLSYGKWQVFEMGKLMEMPSICPHILNYLFHRIETDRLDGSPTLLILDECWVFLRNPQFASQISTWLRTFRKKNASVIFATQSMADVRKSDIFHAIMESCYTRIFLPNPNALEESNKSIYRSFDLNDTEIDIIAAARAKREYYFKSPDGSRLYELALGQTALSWVAASNKDDQNAAIGILNTKGKDDFAYWWYRYKNMNDEASNYLAQKNILSKRL